MTIISSLTSPFKSPMKLITKGLGIGALAAVGYESHYVGKLQADLYASEKDANAAAYYLNNDMYLTDMSKISEGIKDKAYEMELDQGWRRFFNSGIGYIKGFNSKLVDNVIPLSLGLGALLTKGMSAKACAGGLGVYAIAKIIKNFFGLGVPGGPIKS